MAAFDELAAVETGRMRIAVAADDPSPPFETIAANLEATFGAGCWSRGEAGVTAPVRLGLRGGEVLRPPTDVGT